MYDAHYMNHSHQMCDAPKSRVPLTTRQPTEYLSHPDSRFDPIGGSEPVSGCETIYWDSLPDFFFLKADLVPVGMAHIL